MSVEVVSDIPNIHCYHCSEKFKNSTDYVNHISPGHVILGRQSKSKDVGRYEILYQHGQPGSIRFNVRESFKLIDKSIVYPLVHQPICKAIGSLRRFGFYYNENLCADHIDTELKNYVNRHQKEASNCVEYLSDFFVDGALRPRDDIHGYTDSFDISKKTNGVLRANAKNYIKKIRSHMQSVLDKVFPDHTVTYQEHFDRIRALKGNFDTALHEDHTLQHRTTDYDTSQGSLLTTWVALTPVTEAEGLSFLIPDANEGADGGEGKWASMEHALPGATAIFFECQPHGCFRAVFTQPQVVEAVQRMTDMESRLKKFRCSLEMRWSIQDKRKFNGDLFELPKEKSRWLDTGCKKIADCSLCVVRRERKSNLTSNAILDHHDTQNDDKPEVDKNDICNKVIDRDVAMSDVASDCLQASPLLSPVLPLTIAPSNVSNIINQPNTLLVPSKTIDGESEVSVFGQEDALHPNLSQSLLAPQFVPQLANPPLSCNSPLAVLCMNTKTNLEQMNLNGEPQEFLDEPDNLDINKTQNAILLKKQSAISLEDEIARRQQIYIPDRWATTEQLVCFHQVRDLCSLNNKSSNTESAIETLRRHVYAPDAFSHISHAALRVNDANSDEEMTLSPRRDSPRKTAPTSNLLLRATSNTVTARQVKGKTPSGFTSLSFKPTNSSCREYYDSKMKEIMGGIFDDGVTYLPTYEIGQINALKPLLKKWVMLYCEYFSIHRRLIMLQRIANLSGSEKNEQLSNWTTSDHASLQAYINEVHKTLLKVRQSPLIVHPNSVQNDEKKSTTQTSARRRNSLGLTLKTQRPSAKASSLASKQQSTGSFVSMSRKYVTASSLIHIPEPPAPLGLKLLKFTAGGLRVAKPLSSMNHKDEESLDLLSEAYMHKLCLAAEIAVPECYRHAKILGLLPVKEWRQRANTTLETLQHMLQHPTEDKVEEEEEEQQHQGLSCQVIPVKKEKIEVKRTRKSFTSETRKGRTSKKDQVAVVTNETKSIETDMKASIYVNSAAAAVLKDKPSEKLELAPQTPIKGQKRKNASLKSNLVVDESESGINHVESKRIKLSFNDGHQIFSLEGKDNNFSCETNREVTAHRFDLLSLAANSMIEQDETEKEAYKDKINHFTSNLQEAPEQYTDQKVSHKNKNIIQLGYINNQIDDRNHLNTNNKLSVNPQKPDTVSETHNNSSTTSIQNEMKTVPSENPNQPQLNSNTLKEIELKVSSSSVDVEQDSLTSPFPDPCIPFIDSIPQRKCMILLSSNLSARPIKKSELFYSLDWIDSEVPDPEVAEDDLNEIITTTPLEVSKTPQVRDSPAFSVSHPCRTPLDSPPELAAEIDDTSFKSDDDIESQFCSNRISETKNHNIQLPTMEIASKDSQDKIYQTSNQNNSSNEVVTNASGAEHNTKKNTEKSINKINYKNNIENNDKNQKKDSHNDILKKPAVVKNASEINHAIASNSFVSESISNTSNNITNTIRIALPSSLVSKNAFEHSSDEDIQCRKRFKPTPSQSTNVSDTVTQESKSIHISESTSLTAASAVSINTSVAPRGSKTVQTPKVPLSLLTAMETDKFSLMSSITNSIKNQEFNSPPKPNSTNDEAPLKSRPMISAIPSYSSSYKKNCMPSTKPLRNQPSQNKDKRNKQLQEKQMVLLGDDSRLKSYGISLNSLIAPPINPSFPTKGATQLYKSDGEVAPCMEPVRPVIENISPYSSSLPISCNVSNFPFQMFSLSKDQITCNTMFPIDERNKTTHSVGNMYYHEGIIAPPESDAEDDTVSL